MPRGKRRHPVLGSANVEHVVPFEQALKMAKDRRYIHRFVMVGTWNPFKVNTLVGSTTTGGYIASASLKVSKAQLVKWLDDAYPQHVRDKINVRVTTADGFIWIGRTP